MSEKGFLKLSLEEFTERLGSGEPTPGGGAAAALESALGAALLMMVANHTIGKAKYADFEDLNIRARDEAEALREKLLAGVDRDAECFGRVSAAYSLPKSASALDEAALAEFMAKDPSADEEALDELVKAERTQLIGSASIEAAEAPLEVIEASLGGLRLARSILGKSNRNLESDIFVAALSLMSGLSSAAYNVDANLPAIEKVDPGLAESLGRRAAEAKAEAEGIAKEMLG